ncbi:unnamed protein product [Cunninghamella echinulata]
MTTFNSSINFLLKKPSKHLPPLPPLQQLNHFSLWYTRINKKWMMQLNDIINNNQERIIKTLEFEINDKRLIIDEGNDDGYEEYDESSNEDGDDDPTTKIPPPPIYLKTIGPSLRLPRTLDDLYDDNSIVYRKNILIMSPLLNQLTHLDIDSGNYCYIMDMDICNIEEDTFETIHKSCPQLELLSLKNFDVTLSPTFSTLLSDSDSDSSFQLASHLKEFNFFGEVKDCRFYTYFAKKYPQLESLTLCLTSKPIPRRFGAFKLAIFNMMTECHCLKKLHIRLYDPEFDVDLDDGLFDYNRRRQEYWPKNEFLDWLLQHPSQLTHFTYNNELIDTTHTKKRYFIIDKPDQTISSYYKSMINNIIQQPALLSNQLSYLSFTSKFSRDILYNYLVQNKNAIIFSSTIESLTLNEYYYGKKDLLYITDWLDAFPNLTSLSVTKCIIVQDIEDTLQKKEIRINKSFSKNVDALHRLMLQRQRKKQKQQIESPYHSTYKLQELTLVDSEIFMENGFNSIFKACHHLKKLKLNNVKYALSEWDSLVNDGDIRNKNKNNSNNNNTILDTDFNLSQSSLEELCIISMKYIPWHKIYYGTLPLITELIIKETITGNESTVPIHYHTSKSIPSKDSLTAILFLECKNVDKIIFKSNGI